MTTPIRIELPTQFQVGSVNAYLFLTPEPVLIDCGLQSEASWQALQTGLAQHGLRVADLHRVIITHAHVDHYGQAAMIAANSDAMIHCSTLAYDWLADGETMWRKRIAYYEQEFLRQVAMPAAGIEMVLAYMTHTAQTAVSVPVDRLITFQPDDKLTWGGLDWQSIPTPGHASHQTVFYQSESRQLLSADMLLARTPTPVVERPLSGQSRIPALPLFLNSLSQMASLSIEMVYPGHGRPFAGHTQVIQQQLARIQQRKEETFQLVKTGFHTVAALVGKMYGSSSPQLQFAGLWMLVGYLDLLQAEGRVLQTETDGIWHYASSD